MENSELKIIGVVLICVVLTIAGCDTVQTVNRRNAITEALKAGIDPLSIPCAYSLNATSDPTCVVLAAKRP